MNSSDIKIFIVDDDPSVRRSMARLLNATGYHVETLSSAEDYLQTKRSRGPGCLVLDLQMQGLNGLELQKTLTEAGREIPIVFVSGHAHVPESVQAMKGGAVDFLTKPFDQKAFLAAIDRAIAKDHVTRKAQTDQRSVDSRLALLTPREDEVLWQVVKGRLNKQIAFKLEISEKTVKVHRARVMEKMRAGSVADLVRLTEKTNGKNSSSEQ